MKKIGQGTFGTVYKAKTENEIVALKRFRYLSVDQGVESTTIRELSLVQELNHPNIVKLKQVIVKDKVYGVYDYVKQDLMKELAKNGKMTMSRIKTIMWQILSAIAYAHENGIMHRDMKSANILIHENKIQICDFGSARHFSGKYTKEVCTLWWRALELLLGSENYNEKIDMWSIGCIFLEMITGVAPFRGNTEVCQVEAIIEKLGSPPEGFQAGKIKFKGGEKSHLSELFLSGEEDALSLAQGLLEFDPSKRFSALQSLSHPFFSFPLPSIIKLNDPILYYDLIDWTKVQKVTMKMRVILFKWMLEVGKCFNFQNETILQGMVMVDSFLGKKEWRKEKLQLLGVTALFVAGKLVEREIYDVQEFSDMTATAATVKDILKMEMELLVHFNWKLPPVKFPKEPAAKVFATYILQEPFPEILDKMIDANDIDLEKVCK